MVITTPYPTKTKIRLITAAALFDGHDAAINIMRRIMQQSGAEIIHLGHNRSVHEIVQAAIQEDVHGIAITSYQGGHREFFTYLYDLLREKGAGHIKIFGGGGGTILPEEIAELHRYGINRIYSPDDGRQLGLQGMINDLLAQCDFPLPTDVLSPDQELTWQAPLSVARTITALENEYALSPTLLANLQQAAQRNNAPVIGITGTGGAGKSSLTDELVRRFLRDYPHIQVAVLSVDPSKRKTGGALLGDRIRMNVAADSRVYLRSLATRQTNVALSQHVDSALWVLQAAGYDLILLESSGIGQSDTEIVDYVDVSLYVMTPEFGAPTQLEKIDMIDFADLVAINKFDKRGAHDALRDVRKQYQRARGWWDRPLDELPVFGAIASQFNDTGVNQLYGALVTTIAAKKATSWLQANLSSQRHTEKIQLIPPARVRYLAEIAETIRHYNQTVEAQARLADEWAALRSAHEQLAAAGDAATTTLAALAEHKAQLLLPEYRAALAQWDATLQAYQAEAYVYTVRGKAITVPTHTQSLSQLNIPKIATPRLQSWGDRLRWLAQENFPGFFPFTAGVFPFKRSGEDPTRMFAGEGGPERTNRRFHYLASGMPANRLSTAFDSVTLYGEDPDQRPDIYGKIGNSGVSICCLDDLKILYSGFDLCDPRTSVSMTINGPAATMTAFFMNVAIDQQCERYLREHQLTDRVEKALQQHYDNRGLPRPHYRGELPPGHNGLGLLLLGLTGDQVLEPAVYEQIKAKALQAVRGTVQADILKEDQAQNTCIFSTEFSLKLMGDVQTYFVEKNVRNFYSVSISGYHIAEAGANPITQLAFTLANGFTYVEYYLARGMAIDDFAPNLSFFFSNGLDPEYAVIGRVARRIWAKAMRHKYGANERSQLLKYHIQTSGRSLHAQEIDFNDIRTTLQALYALQDNCNSLHTNAFDEAITTPTEDSVRRAVAIQLIINHELGWTKTENPLQGSFLIEALTDWVEEAVLQEFDRLTERGGVLGAMETMYQRSKIQEESLYYESKKHNGELPIVGVNTFLSASGSPTVVPTEVIRSTTVEKDAQISGLQRLLHRQTTTHAAAGTTAAMRLAELQDAAVQNRNIFHSLMETVKVCSLGQITQALYAVGGQYRRNL